MHNNNAGHVGYVWILCGRSVELGDVIRRNLLIVLLGIDIAVSVSLTYYYCCNAKRV